MNIGISSTMIIHGMRADELAEILHDGATIPVTPRMRAMFYYLSMASMGRMDPGRLTGAAAEMWKRQPGGYFGLSEDTTHIEIPPRPFIREVFEDKATINFVQANWQNAFRRAAAMVSR